MPFRWWAGKTPKRIRSASLYPSATTAYPTGSPSRRASQPIPFRNECANVTSLKLSVGNNS